MITKAVYDKVIALVKKLEMQKRELESVESSGSDIFGGKSKVIKSDIDKTKTRRSLKNGLSFADTGS